MVWKGSLGHENWWVCWALPSQIPPVALMALYPEAGQRQPVIFVALALAVSCGGGNTHSTWVKKAKKGHFVTLYGNIVVLLWEYLVCFSWQPVAIPIPVIIQLAASSLFQWFARPTMSSLALKTKTIFLPNSIPYIASSTGRSQKKVCQQIFFSKKRKKHNKNKNKQQKKKPHTQLQLLVNIYNLDGRAGNKAKTSNENNGCRLRMVMGGRAVCGHVSALGMAAFFLLAAAEETAPARRRKTSKHCSAHKSIISCPVSGPGSDNCPKFKSRLYKYYAKTNLQGTKRRKPESTELQ